MGFGSFIHMVMVYCRKDSSQHKEKGIGRRPEKPGANFQVLRLVEPHRGAELSQRWWMAVTEVHLHCGAGVFMRVSQIGMQCLHGLPRPLRAPVAQQSRRSL